jgi:hypothetical protein
MVKKVEKKINFNKEEKSEIRKRVRTRTKAKFSKFHGEMKKSTLTAIVAAFSFLIALSWKELITEWVGKLMGANPVRGKIIEVFIITVIAVFGIILFTHFLGKEE